MPRRLPADPVCSKPGFATYLASCAAAWMALSGCTASDDEMTTSEGSPLALGLAVAQQSTTPSGAQVQLGALPSGGAGARTLTWIQTAGTAVELSDPGSMHPWFIAPTPEQAETLRFEVVVHDRAGDQVSRTVEVDVVPPAFDLVLGSSQRAWPGQTVALNAQVFGLGALAEVTWRQVSGTPVVLDDPHRLDPIFEAPTVPEVTPLDFEFEATHADGRRLRRTTTVDVRPTWATVWAGPTLYAAVGDQPILRATPRGALEAPLAWTWTVTQGELTFDAPQSAETGVTLGTPTTSGRWEVEVSVVDASGVRATTQQSILKTAASDGELFTRGPSDLSMPAGVSARLFAHVSGGDGAYEVQWTDFASVLSISDPTSTTPLITTDPTSSAFLEFAQVSVTDGAAGSDVSALQYSVTTGIEALDAGSDRIVGPGQRVYLNGEVRASGVEQAYQWTKLAGTTISLQAAATDNPYFIAPSPTLPVDFTFELATSLEGGLNDTMVVELGHADERAELIGPETVVEGQHAVISVAPNLAPAPVEVAWRVEARDGEPPVRLRTHDQDPLAVELFVPPMPNLDGNGTVHLSCVVTYPSGRKLPLEFAVEVATRPKVTFAEPLPHVDVPAEQRRMVNCGTVESCDGPPEQVRCPADAPFGMNTIVMPGDGSFEVIKSCAAPDTCRARWWGSSRRDADCVELSHNPTRLSAFASEDTIRICDYCCSGTDCNAPDIPASDTRLSCDASGCR